MTTPSRVRSAAGFSLIELLVVLAIIGALAIVGVNMIGNRQSGAVRSLLDEMEGVLSNAHKAAVATGADVAIVTWGGWDSGAPFRVAHGVASLTDAKIQTIADKLLQGIPPDAADGPAGQTVAIPFSFMPSDPSQTRARIVAIGSDQWKNVMKDFNGKTNTDLSTVEPFKSGIMVGTVTDANNLFSYTTDVKRFVISGSSKRFSTTIVIPIVGTATGGGALPGGPMGLIVVLANGGSIYKFYNPGIRDSDGQWRKI